MSSPMTHYRITLTALLLCAVWVAVQTALGALGLYEYARDDSHALIIASVLTPTTLFGVLFLLSKDIQEWTRRLDLAMLTLPHAWRTVGYTFLTLWALDVLPAGFAAPAGFGDFAIAIAAPFVAVALWLNWTGAIRAAVTFHLIGMLDFFFALLTGITGYGATAEQMAMTDPMTTFPLVVIPTAFVPLLLLSHVMVLTKIAMARSFRVATQPA